MKILSRLFKDRPQNGMDTANYWIEYVIRNGRDSLRSPAMKLTWWQVALLDVLAVTVIGLLTVLYLCLFIVRTIIRLIRGQKRNYISFEKKSG